MKHPLSIILLTLAAGCGTSSSARSAATSPATVAPAATSTQATPGTSAPISLAAWLPYWGVAQGKAALRTALPGLDEVSPFWFRMEPNGSLYAQTNARDPGVTAQAQAAGALVIPTVTRGFDPKATPNLFTDPALRDTAIRALVNEALVGGYDGMDLDFEGLTETDRGPYATFVVQAAAALHAAGKRLAVTVPAKTSSPGAWSGQRAYDWAAIGVAADRFRIMAYDYHWSGGAPGAIAPLDWVEQVGRFARTLVPPDRTFLGVPFYGYDWGAAGTRAKGLVHEEAIVLAAAKGSTIRRDPASGEPWFTYDDGGVGHTVWFQDDRSIEAKVAVARRLGLAGAVAWRLGGESPAFWDAARLAAGK